MRPDVISKTSKTMNSNLDNNTMKTTLQPTADRLRPPFSRLAAALLLAAVLSASFVAHPAGAVMQSRSIQCANLIYAGTNTSRCFSDEFLSIMQRETAIPTERRFRSVRLNSDELFRYPFVMITGESDFTFTPQERENLRKYLTNGGFMLASSGCSSTAWDTAFRRNLNQVLGEDGLELTRIPKEHAIFRTVYNIETLDLARTDEDAYLEGITHQGKIVLVYSRHGLNNTANTNGCCCCGGNEIRNADRLNVNILMYSLLH